PAPPLTDRDYDLWAIDLDDVVASHVREIWVDDARLAGDFDVHGRWTFRPMRALAIGPARIDVRALDASRGERELWASSVSGTIDVTVGPYDLRGIEGAALAHGLTAEGDLRGVLHGPGIVAPRD